MRYTIGIFGGSFNPPTIDHKMIVEKMAKEFNHLVIIPCGTRPDKLSTNIIDLHHRIELVRLGFSDLPSNVHLVLDDISKRQFTPMWQLEEKFANRGDVWHIIGLDLIQNGHSGQSEIQRSWQKGKEIWKRLNFVVVTRSAYSLKSNDLPPHSRLFDWQYAQSSTEVREKLNCGESINHLVTPAVANYVVTHDLYQQQKD